MFESGKSVSKDFKQWTKIYFVQMNIILQNTSNIPFYDSSEQHTFHKFSSIHLEKILFSHALLILAKLSKSKRSSGT